MSINNFWVVTFFTYLVTIGTIGCTSKVFDMKNYEDSLYKVLLVPSPGKTVTDSSASVLRQIIESAVMIGAKVPPGAYADYGSLLYSQGKTQEAIAAWIKEFELYPESKRLTQLLISKNPSSVALDNGLDRKDHVGSEIRHQVRSILIWPPINQTPQPAAAGAFHVTARDPFIEQGYYVLPVLATYTFIRNLGLRDPQNITSSVIEQVKDQLGADAILTITVTEWKKPPNFLGFEGTTVHVRANYRLIEVPTGKDLWSLSSRNEVNEQVTGGAGGPVVAVTNDHLIPARVLNKKAIDIFLREFPPGPYASRKPNN